MTKLFKNPVAIAHQWLALGLQRGSICVDATAGNGYDTLFLAQAVGPTGKVYAFDIQARALAETTHLLQQHDVLDGVRLIHAGHEHILDYIAHPIDRMVFNLGYLPQGDKTIVTRPESTILALSGGMRLLNSGGLIVLTVYTGHEQGQYEWQELQKYLREIPQAQWNVVQLGFLNRFQKAPFNIGIERNG